MRIRSLAVLLAVLLGGVAAADDKADRESESAKKVLYALPELTEKEYGKERRKDVEKAIAFLVQVHKEVAEDTLTSKRANKMIEDIAPHLRTADDFKILLKAGGKYKPIKDKNLTLEEAWPASIRGNKPCPDTFALAIL